MVTILPLNRRGIPASRIALGCMGLGGGWNQDPLAPHHRAEAHRAVDAALEAGINFFDHADIYTRGKAETVFGQVLADRPDLREHIFIQTKCGIRFPEGSTVPGRYDFSQEHIVHSVEGSLSRLGVEYLDILLLHRPDPLMEPDEVAAAFDALAQAGKVRWFGVSNMHEGQMRLLASRVREPLIVNQLEMSLAHLGWLDGGVHVNQEAARNNTFPDGTLEYCQLENIQLQAWSPLARGRLTGGEPASETERNTAALLAELAGEWGVSADAVAVAWLLRHPAGIQPIIGTKTPERIAAQGQALDVTLSREQWYRLYVTARGAGMP